MSIQHIYPITIIQDRYGGAYSGARWLAFNLHPGAIPDAIGGTDEQEEAFWRSNGDSKNYLIGKGHYPNLAASDLFDKFTIKNQIK